MESIVDAIKHSDWITLVIKPNKKIYLLLLIVKDVSRGWVRGRISEENGGPPPPFNVSFIKSLHTIITKAFISTTTKS